MVWACAIWMLAALLGNFEAEEQAEVVPAPAVPHAPPRPVVPSPAPQAPLGRSAGFAQSSITKARISRGVLSRNTKQLKEQVGQVSATLAEECCLVAFGCGQPDKVASSQRNHQIRAAGLVEVIDNETRYNHQVHRAVVSHIKAQSKGLADFLVNSAADSSGLIVSMSFDDASMWVQSPRPPDHASDKKLRHRGRNKHMPVLNRSELMVSAAGSSSRMWSSGADVFAPAVVLPQGNDGTVGDRL